jgi:uncharacterized SAM-binding protein YcdF (DUF218 family)
LALEGWAPWIVFSGGLGNLTRDCWTRPEAELFAERAEALGVPRERILIENQSSNTGENICFTQRLLEERGISWESAILVQKPYMERRTWATARVYWPHKRLMVTSPPVSFEEYPNEEITPEAVIHIMVGDLQRIRHYPGKGFQVPQDIPESVWAAFERLVGWDMSGILRRICRRRLDTFREGRWGGFFL